MVDVITVTDYSDYDSFARDWHADELADLGVSLLEAREREAINEDETRLWWQLLGQLDDEVLVRIPEWLAEEKVGFVEGSTPTVFIGRIEDETEKAIRLGDSASARPLLKVAHRIEHLESGADTERDEWLDDRLAALRERFEQRENTATLQNEWLPKSQLRLVARRA